MGDDASSGPKPQSPWRTLECASAADLREGDQLLLAAGRKLSGQLTYEGLAGSALHPIVIASYGDTNAAGNLGTIVAARGWGVGVQFRNSQHVEIRNLLITADAGGMDPRVTNTAMRCGVLVEGEERSVSRRKDFLAERLHRREKPAAGPVQQLFLQQLDLRESGHRGVIFGRPDCPGRAHRE